jgi:hypothetical protein
VTSLYNTVVRVNHEAMSATEPVMLVTETVMPAAEPLMPPTEFADEIQDTRDIDSSSVPPSMVVVPPVDGYCGLPHCLHIDGLTVYEAVLVAPFERSTMSDSVIASEGNYNVLRANDSHRALVMGSSPLMRQVGGVYFEVRISGIVEGFTGGLAIGITQTKPTDLTESPAQAEEIPLTIAIGYSSCIYLNGFERSVTWDSSRLQVGQRIGLLITDDGQGDLIVFEDQKPVVRIDGSVLSEAGLGNSPMYPIVELFGSISGVTLCPRSTVPPRPWDVWEERKHPSDPALATVPLMSDTSQATRLDLAVADTTIPLSTMVREQVEATMATMQQLSDTMQVTRLEVASISGELAAEPQRADAVLQSVKDEWSPTSGSSLPQTRPLQPDRISVGAPIAALKVVDNAIAALDNTTSMTRPLQPDRITTGLLPPSVQPTPSGTLQATQLCPMDNTSVVTSRYITLVDSSQS